MNGESPTTAPALSVVVPVHGRTELAIAAVRSVLCQSLKDLEVIVVDDGAPETAAMLMETVGEPRVRLVHHAMRRGAAAARNTGVSAAKAEVVAFLDSDDRWLQGMADAQISALSQAKPPVVGVTTAYLVERCDGHLDLRRPRRERDSIVSATRGCHLAPGATLAIRRSAWTELGGLDESLERLEDWDLVLRMAELGMALEFLDRPLARVRWSVPGPSPETVRTCCQIIVQKHATWLESRARHLGRRLRATVDYEIGLASLRHSDINDAMPLLWRAVMLDPMPRIWALCRATRRRLTVSTGPDS